MLESCYRLSTPKYRFVYIEVVSSYVFSHEWISEYARGATETSSVGEPAVRVRTYICCFVDII